MKKNIVFCSICFLVLVLGCEKGPDDPFLSLKSRSGRLEGNWQLKSGTLSITRKNPKQKYPDETYTFTGNSYSYAKDPWVTSSGLFSIGLTFDKKGEFRFKQDFDQIHYSGSGTWDFLGRIGADRNKETINFNISSITGGSNWLDVFNKANYNFSYKVRELRKEKLVLECLEELVSVSNSDSTSVYITSNYVFVR